MIISMIVLVVAVGEGVRDFFCFKDHCVSSVVSFDMMARKLLSPT